MNTEKEINWKTTNVKKKYKIQRKENLKQKCPSEKKKWEREWCVFSLHYTLLWSIHSLRRNRLNQVWTRYILFCCQWQGWTWWTSEEVSCFGLQSYFPMDPRTKKQHCMGSGTEAVAGGGVHLWCSVLSGTTERSVYNGKHCCWWELALPFW